MGQKYCKIRGRAYGDPEGNLSAFVAGDDFLSLFALYVFLCRPWLVIDYYIIPKIMLPFECKITAAENKIIHIVRVGERPLKYYLAAFT